jgi:hypothetical protein
MLICVGLLAINQSINQSIDRSFHHSPVLCASHARAVTERTKDSAKKTMTEMRNRGKASGYEYDRAAMHAITHSKPPSLWKQKIVLNKAKSINNTTNQQTMPLEKGEKMKTE